MCRSVATKRHASVMSKEKAYEGTHLLAVVTSFCPLCVANDAKSHSPGNFPPNSFPLLCAKLLSANWGAFH